MKCPKCSQNIDDDALLCPNCKKVLKLICPKCKTVNKKNTCKKCGFIIVTKCHECGKINQTSIGRCTKCGFSTYTSASINSSNIDEFACMTIEFPNISDIKTALGSTKLFEKFKENLDKLISNYTYSIDLTKEIINNVYVIRFNKDYTFAKSANRAIKSAIEIQNLVTELNFKLDKLKNTALHCHIAILKRNIYSKPTEYKSGFDVRLIYQNQKKDRLLNNLQIVTDSGVYEAVCDNYSLSTLTAVQIKNEFVMFFELKIKKYIKLPKEDADKEKENEFSKLPYLSAESTEDFENAEANEDTTYNIESINFDELRCNFIKTQSIYLIPEIVKNLKQNKKSIIAVKCEKRFEPKTEELLNEIEKTGKFNKIFRVTCCDEMKYKPYGFFYELISSIYNFSQSPKNFPEHDFSLFNELDPSGYIKDLINMNRREFPHPEDVRYSLFDIFLNLFYSMKNSLLYIENLEKIDDTSYEVLQLLFEKFDVLDVSYLTVSNNDFSLHKNAHFLLSKSYYTEIIPKPTPFKEIIKSNIEAYKPILESYYMQKLALNTKGSLQYFNQAINYLLEKNLIKFDENVFSLENFENILIPTTLEELIIKRFNILSRDTNAYKLMGLLLLIGPRIDIMTLKLLNYENDVAELKKLAEKGYIYSYQNAIYVQNYNLYKEIFFKNMNLDVLNHLASELLENIYSTDVAVPNTAILYNLVKQEKSEFLVWEKLSHLNTSMGDFSAYLNCSVRFLKLIDNHLEETSEKTINDYKMEVYENLANLLYKYTPEKIQNIAQIILENLEKSTDDKKVINLCNKMLQGCLISGDYSHALRLIHKILSKFSLASLNPKDNNFDVSYFLISLVKIEVLFSIGNLKDCIESGDEILNVINKENIENFKPEHLSTHQFKEIIFDTIGFVALSRIILLKTDLNEFLSHLEINLGGLPKTFELFLLLQKTLYGEVEIPDDFEILDDKFSKILFNLILAFNNKADYQKFASYVYQSKINAKLQNLHQIELICDLLIGYSYSKLKEYKKASSIYHSVIGSSSENGLKFVTYLAWYFVSILNFELNEIEMAYGISNNIIIQLEKDENSSELLILLFKLSMSKILATKNEKKSSQLCLNHAIFIKDKYGINLNLE